VSFRANPLSASAAARQPKRELNDRQPCAASSRSFVRVAIDLSGAPVDSPAGHRMGGAAAPYYDICHFLNARRVSLEFWKFLALHHGRFRV
jgi:hypothetical protein